MVKMPELQGASPPGPPPGRSPWTPLAAPRPPAFGSSTSLKKNPPTFRPAYGPEITLLTKALNGNQTENLIYSGLLVCGFSWFMANLFIFSVSAREK